MSSDSVLLLIGIVRIVKIRLMENRRGNFLTLNYECVEGRGGFKGAGKKINPLPYIPWISVDSIKHSSNFIPLHKKK